MKSLTQKMLSKIFSIYGLISSIALTLAILAKHSFFDFIPYIYLFGIGFFYILIHNILLLLWAGFIKHTTTLILLLIPFALGYESFSENYSFRSTPPTIISDSADEKVYSILSLNVGHFNETNAKRKTLKLIDSLSPDFILFQELSGVNNMKVFNANMKKKGYPFFKGYYTNRIFSKYPITKFNRINILKNNTALHTTIQLENETTLLLYNTHLLSNRVTTDLKEAKSNEKVEKKLTGIYRSMLAVNGLREKRKEQAQVLLAETKKTNDFPILIAGDFNSVPNSNVYTKFKSNYTDHFTTAGVGSGFSFNKIPFLRIDYIFSNDKIIPLSYKVLSDSKLSDHNPIYSTFRIKK